MAEVELQINGVPHRVGCEDGQETRLKALAEIVDQHARTVAERVGVFADGKLYLMTALMIADELADARDRLSAGQSGGADAPYESSPSDSSASESKRPASDASEPAAAAAAEQGATETAETAEASPSPSAAIAVRELAEGGFTIPEQLWLDPEIEQAMTKLMNGAARRLSAIAEEIEAA